MGTPALATRKPTGAVPWPFVLVEGPEKVGKSWAIAELSTSDRVGAVYWIDLGEGAADEYGAIPGTNYEVIVHDGSWWSIIGQVDAVAVEAQRAVDAGEPPVVLAIDSGTALWDLLKGWVDELARDRLRRKGRRVSEEVTISMDLWNLAGGRHSALITKLHHFPGIIVVTARGKEVAALDDNGKPIEGQKTYKVEGQKNLAHDASVWVRYSRDAPPRIIGCRSVHYGVRPGVDAPKPAGAGFTLERLIFDVLKCDPAAAHVRDVAPLSGGELAEHERTDQPSETPQGGRQEQQRPSGATAPDPSVARARNAVVALLDATTDDRVVEVAAAVASRGASDLDATAHIPEDDRSTLGIDDTVTVTVDDLIAFVGSYWAKHHHGPRQVPEGPAA